MLLASIRRARHRQTCRSYRLRDWCYHPATGDAWGGPGRWACTFDRSTRLWTVKPRDPACRYPTPLTLLLSRSGDVWLHHPDGHTTMVTPA